MDCLYSTFFAYCHLVLYVAILRDPGHHRQMTGLVRWLLSSQELKQLHGMRHSNCT